MKLALPAEYPFMAPSLKFITPCFHPNISSATGRIFPNFLQVRYYEAKWSLRSIITRLRLLLNSPYGPRILPRLRQ